MGKVVEGDFIQPMDRYIGAASNEELQELIDASQRIIEGELALIQMVTNELIRRF